MRERSLGVRLAAIVALAVALLAVAAPSPARALGPDENLDQLKRIPGSAFQVVRGAAHAHAC